MKKRLDIGCGNNKKKGAIGFDIVECEGVDIVGDMNKTLPFESNDIDVVYLDNVLEHVDNLTSFLKEIHRITKPTGKVYIKIPYYNSPLACIDPTHKHYFTFETIDYYSDQKSWNYYFDFQFRIIKKFTQASFIGRLIPEKIRIKLSQYIGNLILFLYYVVEPIKK